MSPRYPNYDKMDCISVNLDPLDHYISINKRRFPLRATIDDDAWMFYALTTDGGDDLQFTPDVIQTLSHAPNLNFKLKLGKSLTTREQINSCRNIRQRLVEPGPDGQEIIMYGETLDDSNWWLFLEKDKDADWYHMGVQELVRDNTDEILDSETDDDYDPENEMARSGSNSSSSEGGSHSNTNSQSSVSSPIVSET